MDLAPIVLFVYNRPWHTLQTLEALSQNELADKSTLYIFSDGPKNIDEIDKVKEVRELITSKQWCKEVIINESKVNKGLADSIIEGVTRIINKYEKIIVLEDDLITSIGYLKYMNEALKLYKDYDKIMHISGYMYPLNIELPDTLFLNVVTPWGWGTWKRAWDFFISDVTILLKLLGKKINQSNFNKGYGREFYEQLVANKTGKMKTWAVKWHTSIYLQSGYCLHPGRTLIENIGFDNSGIHCNDDSTFKNKNIAEYVKVNHIEIKETKEILKAFRTFYLINHKKEGSLIKKIILKTSKLWNLQVKE